MERIAAILPGGWSIRAPGERLGPYALVRQLGAGGQGEVWEAVLHGPAGFRKQVALKLLRAGPSDAAGRAALLREARLGALLQHPNVVGTLHLSEHDGTWCVALELVRGQPVETLRRHAGGRLPPGVVVEIGVQAAAALDHIHGFEVDGERAGLVHRDVKPANLLVDRSGLVKLADLGISLLHGETDGAAGTPGFMPPEQVRGRPEARSDLFALGATLYLIATGERPFGRGTEALGKVEGVESLLARERFLAPVEDAVPGLAVVVRSCLRRDPAQRPASARALLQALTALRARHPPGQGLLELLARASPHLGLDLTPTPASDEATRMLPTGNLRPPRDRFVGREAELRDLEDSVGGERWVVLVGPGGAGKTRLALEVARRVQHRLAGGAWAFDLSRARSEDELCGAVAAGLSLELERKDPVGQLGRVLAAKGRTLFVLDNLEQCAEALPGTVGRWLDQAADACFLGTSRVVPGLLGERTTALGELAPEDAVALFHARAPRALSEAERAEVEPLCRALEGMPLSIELAAARLRLMDVPTVRSRLSLALLSGGSAERPERHRSVAASLRWSWSLLSPVGRTALAQLSLFEGGFALPAAEAVLDLRAVPGAPWALDVLQELSEASLLQTDVAEGRFRMRVPVREFAASLLSAEERAAAEVRHGIHYAQLGADHAVEAFGGRGDLERPRTLARELDNLVAAARRATARGDGPVAVATARAATELLSVQGPYALAAELCAAAAAVEGLSARARARIALAHGVVLHGLGRPSEAGARLDAALLAARATGDPGLEAEVLRFLGAAVQQARPDQAQAHYDAALALVRAKGDRRAEGIVLSDLGTLHREQGRPEQARADLEGALALIREAGDRRAEGTVLANLGSTYLTRGEPERARAHYLAASAIFQQTGNRRGQGHVHHNLGIVLQDYQASPDQASAHYRAALELHREVGDRRAEGLVLASLGLLDHTGGRRDEARAHLEAALALHREVGNRRAEGVALGYLGMVARARGDVEAARTHFEAALALHREVGNRRFEGIVLGDLGSLSLSIGRLEEAREQLGAALAVQREVLDRRSEGIVLAGLGTLHQERGEPGEARACFERALALQREVGDPRLQGITAGSLGALLCELGHVDEAQATFDAGEALLRSSRDGLALGVLLCGRARLEHATGRTELARATLAEAERLGGTGPVDADLSRALAQARRALEPR